MFDIDIVKDMQDYYELYFKVTSHHKNRRKNDMQPEFSYAHWLKEATKSEYLKVDPKRYKHEIIRDGPIAYISYSNDMKKNIPLLEKELRNHNQNRKHTKVPHFSECMREIICPKRIWEIYSMGIVYPLVSLCERFDGSFATRICHCQKRIRKVLRNYLPFQV